MATPQAWADDRRLGAGGNHFGGIRLLLAVGVLWSHSYPIAGGISSHDPLQRLTHHDWTLGTLCVNAFLLISGFCIAQSLEHSRGVRDFVVRRVRRVYPGFLVLSLLTAFVVAPYFAMRSPCEYSGRQLLLIAFEAVNLVDYGWPYGGLMSVFSENALPGTINSSLWTVRYEFVCYLVLATMSVAGLLRTPKWCVTLAVAASVTSGLVALGLKIPWHKALTAIFGNWPHWPRFLAYFFVGVTFYLLRRRIPYSGGLALLSAGGLLVGLVVPVVGHTLGPLFASSVIFWLAFQRYVNLSRPSAYGDFSYGFYLWAFPTQQAVTELSGGTGLSPTRVFLLSMPPTLLLAAASWFLVERRFLRRSLRVAGAAAPVPAASRP